MDDDLKIFLSDVKLALTEIKVEIKELRKAYDSFRDEKGIMQTEIALIKSCQLEMNKDIDCLAESIRKHNETSDPFRDDVKGLKFQMTLIKWIFSIVGSAIILFELGKLFKIL